MYERRQRDQKSFYCPNGHGQSYCESTEQKLRAQLAQDAKTRERLETEIRHANEEVARQRMYAAMSKRSASAMRGEVTKIKNRAAAGVCPCCHRTISQMARHMATKHPDFVASEEPIVKPKVESAVAPIDDPIIKMLSEGLKYGEIAAKVNKSYMQVYYHVKKVKAP